MIEIPTTEPVEIIAGDTLSWKKYLSDYLPSDDWTLKYAFINSEGKIDIESTADENYHLIEETSATTALWTPGIYNWKSYVENSDSDRYTIATGTIEIKPDLAMYDDGLDTRSHAKIMLDAIEDILEGAGTAKSIDLVSKALGGNSITRDRERLKQWRNYYKAEYNMEIRRERIKQGKSSGATAKVRFI